MRTDDIETVVAVHLLSFPSFFLTFLGPTFLQHLYTGICSAEEGIAFVYLDSQGVPGGFVAGTSNPRGFYSRLLKASWYKFAWASLIPILKKPSIFARVARAVLHPSENPAGDDIAGLFSIGVLPELQGTGAGRILVEAFVQEATERGCKSVVLATDRFNNERVNTFYVRLGFRVYRHYTTREGRRMVEYLKDIQEKP